MQKHKKYERQQENVTPPKLNNSIVTKTNDDQVDETSDEEFKK
jgi:hypothetical protein